MRVQISAFLGNSYIQPWRQSFSAAFTYATIAFAWPCPMPYSDFSHSTTSMWRLESNWSATRSSQYCMGWPYFVSMLGKYEAGPFNFSPREGVGAVTR